MGGTIEIGVIKNTVFFILLRQQASCLHGKKNIFFLVHHEGDKGHEGYGYM